MDYDSDGTREQCRVIPSSQPSEEGLSDTLVDDVELQRSTDYDLNQVSLKLESSPLKGQDAVLSSDRSSQNRLSGTFVEADASCCGQVSFHDPDWLCWLNLFSMNP